jgi:hypothetical protein
MDQLEVPLLLPGLQVQGDEARVIEVVAGTVAAVDVNRRRFDRTIDKPGNGIR